MRYQQLLALIDQYNQQDPNQETIEGTSIAKEVLYSQRMAAQLSQFRPVAQEALKIAVYAQHIGRWEIARTDFPEGRLGYLNWRKQLAQHHAKITGQLMAQAGYSDAEQARVKDIIQKKNLKSDPLSQDLEDVACLVFLEYYLAPMLAKHSDEKLIPAIQKTWRKMSAESQHQALAKTYTARLRDLLERSLEQ